MTASSTDPHWRSNVLAPRTVRQCLCDMSAGQFRFGQFEFDAAKLELRREGVPVHLQSQPAQVLAFLVEHSNQVVSRDDLRRTIWGDKTFVDFTAGLNFCISQIRTALQDDSARPLYIQTVPKLGYRFIAPVERLHADLLRYPNALRLKHRGLPGANQLLL